MLGPLDHIGSALAYFATARRQQTSDMLTARQHGKPLPLAKGLELTWLGTAGFRLAYQGVVVWLDPYVTRMSLPDLLRRKVVPPSQEAISRWVDRADAVLVGHTHFDHALIMTNPPEKEKPSIERYLLDHPEQWREVARGKRAVMFEWVK